MRASKELIKGSKGLEMRLKCSGGENWNFKQLWKIPSGLQIFFTKN